MNRSVTRFARRLGIGALLLGAPIVAHAGNCDDSPARCTRPATATTSAVAASVPRPVTPAPAIVRTPGAAPRVAAPARVVRPSAAPAPPSLTAKRGAATPTDRADKAIDKASEADTPAVPGLGRLLRMNAGTDDEISWLRAPKAARERAGSLIT